MSAGNLSHGQKQWLEIGMLLMQAPRAAARGRAGRRHDAAGDRAHGGIADVAGGKHSVIVVEHDMEFVRSIARKVTVLHEGHVLAEGSIDQVQSDPKVIEVYLGE